MSVFVWILAKIALNSLSVVHWTIDLNWNPSSIYSWMSRDYLNFSFLIFTVNRTYNDFAFIHFPVYCSTVAVAVILCLYLAKHKMPIPVWTPSDGFRIIRYPLHQVFAVSLYFNLLLDKKHKSRAYRIY